MVKAVEDLQAKNVHLQREIEVLQKEKAMNVKGELKGKIQQIGDVHFLGEILSLDGASIKDILFQLKGETENFLGVLGGNEGETCTLSIIASDSIIAAKGFNAGTMIREAAKHIQGGGGGQPFFATAGGKNPSGLQAALDEIRSKLN